MVLYFVQVGQHNRAANQRKSSLTKCTVVNQS